MLEALHVVPQPGSQVSYTHLLLLQGCEVLLRGRGPDPVVVAAGRVLRLAPGSRRLGGKKRSFVKEGGSKTLFMESWEKDLNWFFLSVPLEPVHSSILSH